MADRDTENLRRLQAYDMAESRGSKPALAREKLDLARDKFDFDQTYKAAENERKIQESAMRVQAAEVRSTIAEKQLGLQTKAQELRDLQNEMRLQDAERATQDKIGFLKATRDLKEDAVDFDTRMADAMAQFPNANKDEMIQKRVGWMLDSRKVYLERARTDPITKEMSPTKVVREGVTYESKQDDTGIKPLERERELYARELSKARDRRNRAKDEDNIKVADADVIEYQKKLSEAESQIQVRREGGKANPAQDKTLDSDTAKSILSEAGGDKTKARELAKQRGYSF